MRLVLMALEQAVQGGECPTRHRQIADGLDLRARAPTHEGSVAGGKAQGVHGSLSVWIAGDVVFERTLQNTGNVEKLRTVKSLYCDVNRVREFVVSGSRSPVPIFPVPNLTLQRRSNVLALFQAHLEQSVAAGASPKGLEQQFAAQVAISPSMWSQIKSSRPIGDKLARQIESLCEKPAGWLDEAREDTTPTPAEAAFLELALAAWRATNAAGRKALREQMKAIAQPAA
jgi:hypothetical protein